MYGWTINRSIDSRRMACFLDENARRPRYISIFSPRHRATLELARKEKMGLRFRPPDQNVETRKWVLLHNASMIHTQAHFIYCALYTATRVTLKLLGGTRFAARQIILLGTPEITSCSVSHPPDIAPMLC